MNSNLFFWEYLAPAIIPIVAGFVLFILAIIGIVKLVKLLRKQKTQNLDVLPCSSTAITDLNKNDQRTRILYTFLGLLLIIVLMLGSSYLTNAIMICSIFYGGKVSSVLFGIMEFEIKIFFPFLTFIVIGKQWSSTLNKTIKDIKINVEKNHPPLYRIFKILWRIWAILSAFCLIFIIVIGLIIYFSSKIK